MASQPENWEKSRSRGMHFSEQEKRFIEMAYREGRKAEHVARELKCSTRSIHRAFAAFNGKMPSWKRKPKPPPVEVTPVSKPIPDRFYRGNFEL